MLPTYTLRTTVHTPIFFGLFYSKHEVELASFFTWCDAVSYAYNVMGFDHCDQFTVKENK